MDRFNQPLARGGIICAQRALQRDRGRQNASDTAALDHTK
jgi:hypothetical protein